jgi:hypothetical protein
MQKAHNNYNISKHRIFLKKLKNCYQRKNAIIIYNDVFLFRIAYYKLFLPRHCMVCTIKHTDFWNVYKRDKFFSSGVKGLLHTTGIEISTYILGYLMGHHWGTSTVLT